MAPKYATVAIDSASELARLYFTKAMGKHSASTEAIREVSNYPPATERLNMLIRRLKNLRDAGTEIVFTAHEDIQKVYARGGMIAKRGEAPQEPIAVKGWPDMPGNRTPDEMCRAADNVLRVRSINGKPQWIAKRELLGGGGDYWEVKDRFNGKELNGGYLPASYSELAKLALGAKPMLWNPAYIWIIYGSFGIGKTRSLLTFPRPLKLFDLDRGAKSILYDVRLITEKEGPEAFVIESYDVEDVDSYDPFVASIAKCF